MNDQNEANVPLVLAKTGWVYAGGHVETIENKQYTVGQIYAEYMIAAERRCPYPVIMVHGGTMSGTNYTGTPDVAKAGRRISFAADMRFMSSTRSERDARPTSRAFMARKRHGTWGTISRVMWLRKNSGCGRKRISTRNGRVTVRSRIRLCSSSFHRSSPRSKISTTSRSSTPLRSSR